ncbi:MAG: GspH/FimT family pseudopilin [Planctomycetes bacterium]|nr:GspH/FimT family pseudopilin [Planctomycetota bacterium]
MRSRRGGLTLTELLVVMVVIAVVAGLVAPSFTGFFPGLKVQKAADELVAVLSKARTDAALTQHRYRLCVQVSDPPAYWLAYERDPLGEPGVFQRVAGAWGEPQALPEDVTLEALEGALEDVDAGPRYYEFRPDGTATAGAFTVAHPKAEGVTIRIDGATARVEMEKL